MFLLRAWNSDLDEEIIRILENEGKTYFYHLWKELGVSKRTLNDHIKRMEDQEIIEKDGHPQIGKKRFYRFHPHAIFKKSLDILDTGKKSRTSNETNEKRNAIRLLVYMANRGTHVTSHQELNLGKKEKRLLIDPSFQLICPGFSENDILTGNIFPAYAPRPYVNDASPTELKKMFSNLRNLGLIVPISTVNGETRFGFGDEVNHNCSEDQICPKCGVHKFVSDCSSILDMVIRRMLDKWIGLGKKITRDEINWYASIFGERKKELFLRNIVQERQQYHETTILANKEWFEDTKRYGDFYTTDVEHKLEKRKTNYDIDCLRKMDVEIKNKMLELESNHSEFQKTNTVICELVKEMIFPAFLEKRS